MLGNLSKKEDKDKESKQSSTTPDPGQRTNCENNMLKLHIKNVYSLGPPPLRTLYRTVPRLCYIRFVSSTHFIQDD